MRLSGCAISKEYSLERFIYTKPFPDNPLTHYILMSDIAWWVEHLDEVKLWLEQNATGHWNMSGAILTFYSERDTMWFIATWG
jgi:hypothetical protein